MAMNVGSSGGEDEPMVEMNTTPLIDVLLVLLIMLIITIPIQTHAVKLDMPRPTNAPVEAVKPEIVNLEVDFDGSIIWNGSYVGDEATFESYLRTAAATVPQPEVHLRPNRLAKYDHVAHVLATAQRLGVLKIGFVGNEQYMD